MLKLQYGVTVPIFMGTKVHQYSRHTFITKRQRCALFNVLASAAPCATKAGGSKLAALELWPPYANGISAEKDDFVKRVFWQFPWIGKS